MDILIIEDERRAAERLKRLICEADSSLNVAGILESVRETVSFFDSNTQVELIFSDIQLADGLSFEIFHQVEIKCPIIFTTAYDQYAIEAFKTNGIDYLLKPVSLEDLQKAITKFRRFSPSINAKDILAITQAFSGKNNDYKSRFMVKVGEHIKSVPIEEISHFSSEHKATYLHTTSGKRFIIDYSLEQLTNSLKPERFFRINRKYFVAIDSIMDIVAYSNSQLRIKSKYTDVQDLTVSREKVVFFKKWLDR